MSSTLTETRTRGQSDRPVKVCDALGPFGRAWLRTRLICGGCSAADVKREKQGHSSAAAMHAAFLIQHSTLHTAFHIQHSIQHSTFHTAFHTLQFTYSIPQHSMQHST